MAEFQTEKEMMETPDKWPHMLLPLTKKDSNGHTETAYKVDGRPVIFMGNVFVANAEDQRVEFLDTEAIIDAGWKVD